MRPLRHQCPGLVVTTTIGLLLATVAIGLVFFFATAPQAVAAPPQNPFPDRRPAPSLEGGVGWLNTGGPISLDDLEGKIVLLDFWTYCCINCIHVLPDLEKLEKKYDRELVVIGVHSAKFENEKQSDAIREAIMRYNISHPVINDANMTIWNKFNVRSWPTLVLIGPEGKYCGYVSGEGNFEILDTKIGALAKYHAAKGNLDRTPVDFALERESAPATPLRYPGKILADGDADRLYISDSNHNRIVITKLDGTLVDIVGSGRIGAADGGYDEAEFDHPQGMTLDGRTLYVADTENHLIRAVNLDTKTVSTLAGTGKKGGFGARGGRLLETPLNSPWDLLAHNGTLYIAMAGPHQIWSHQLGSDRIGVFAGTGREDITDGPRNAANFAQPSGLATDGTALFVCDSEGSAIRRIPFAANRPVTTIAGTSDLPRGRSLFEFGDNDGPGAKARLQHPLGAVFHNGKLFIADSYNHKIKQITEPRPGQSRVTTLYGDGEDGTHLDPLEFAEPSGLDVARGGLFVADTNNHRVLRINLISGDASVVTIDGLAPPNLPKATEEVASVEESETVKVPARSVRAATSLPVTVSVALPDGFKLNPDYPITVSVSGERELFASDDQPARLEAQRNDGTIAFKLPMTGEAGDDTLTITTRYGYCRGGSSGLCKVNSVRWSVPIRTAEDGETSIRLATPEPEEPAPQGRANLKIGNTE